MSKFLAFFRSIRTAVALLSGLLVFLFVGSMLMPARPDTYEGMNRVLLFEWLAAERGNPVHFWFWIVLALLVLLTLNTLTCSLDALIKKMNRREFLLRISPQLMHVGFLLILLAHLLSSGWGFKTGGGLPEGQSGRLPDGMIVRLNKLDISFHPSGMPRSWTADVDLMKDGVIVDSGRLGPNQPLFHDGMGVYLKSLRGGNYGPVAELVVARDPGVPWALLGAVVFTLGNGIFLWLRIRMGS